MRRHASRFIRILRTCAATAAVAATLLQPGLGGARAEEIGGAVALYGWLPAIDGTVTSKSSGRSVETSISAGDLLESLEFGMMGAGEVHYGRFALMNDTVYSKLGNGGTVSSAPSVSVDVDTKLLMSTTAVGYHAYVEDGRLIEPFVGLKYVWMKTDVKATTSLGKGAAIGAGIDAHWWDPVIGVRGRLPLTDTLTAGGVAEIGGFGAGSEFTWQIFAGLEYAISERTSANIGFRYLSIRYSADRRDVDIEQYGPLLGLSMTF